MKNDPVHVTFFGGGKREITPEYEESVMIGKILSQKGFIVKCGGYGGLMEACSLGVNSKGGIIIGYTCKTFGHTKGNKYLSETVICEDIYDRLRYLIKDSEIFIIQKGGIGTISELVLVLDENRKTKSKKIIVMGNYMKEKLKFLDESDYNSIIFCENITEFEKIL